MSSPILGLLPEQWKSIATLAIALTFFAAARYFKKLDENVHLWLRQSVFAGVMVALGLLLAVIVSQWQANILLTGLFLTLAASTLESRNHDSDLFDGLLTGSAIGLGTSLTQVVLGHGLYAEITRYVLSGAVSGIGAAIALRQTRRWVYPTLAGSAFVATLCAAIPALPILFRVREITVTGILLVSIPMIVMAAVFFERRTVIRELTDEAALGILDCEEIALITHPLRRLGTGRWNDLTAFRKYAQIATELAVRKSQQRRMSAEAARLYQLEILKLRMELQEVARIRNSIETARRLDDFDSSSDRMLAE